MRRTGKNATEKLECIVHFSKRIHPKTTVQDGDWQVCLVDIEKVIDGIPYMYRDVNLIGNMVAMTDKYNTSYRIIGILQPNERYGGMQYNVVYSQEVYVFDTYNKQVAFLNCILTQKQLNNLIKAYPQNPIKPLEDRDLNALTKVSGIGERTAYKLITRFESCRDKGKAYVELATYGITATMINKLVEHYESPDIAVAKIKENPYLLIEDVTGIGFSKADEIALKGGLDKFDWKRCKAYIIHYFRERASEGHSFVLYDELVDAVEQELEGMPYESIQEAMRNLEKEGKIWFKDTGDDILVALKYYYMLESNVAKHLKRLMEAPSNLDINEEEAMRRIGEQEAKQGWKFTEQQLEGIFTAMNNNVTIIRGYGGCVDCDTEFFNGYEWKRIADYKVGDKVLQYNKDGSATLVVPKKYVKYEEDIMYHFATKYGTDQCLSLEHRVVYRTSKGNLHVKPFHEVLKDHNNCKSGFTGKFYTTFDYNDGVGIDKTDDEIRLQIAYMADGHFSNNTNYCRMNLKKKRKQQRLEQLLHKLNIDYNCVEKDDGFKVYTFYAMNREKEFESYWYNCTQHQFEVVCDEVLHWDGSTINKDRFCSNSKKTVDFIQFAFATVGKRCNILVDDRIGQKHSNNNDYTYKNKNYYFSVTNRNMVGIGGFHEGQTKTPIVPVKTKDGYKYCFEVDSSMLVLRRNGKIFITGNTGKSSCVTGLLACADEDYRFKQCALSGKASVNLTDITGQEGYTIHRLLEVDPITGRFNHNECFPLLTDLVILDEGSMVDVALFESLIQAIPTGAKLIILGDTNQLESIGVGNILLDMIDSGEVPVVTFDKVHRQGAKSAIIGESIKIAQGQKPVGYGWEGTNVLGELKDLKYIGFTCDRDSKKPTIDLIMKEFKTLYNECKDISQIAVIVPTRERGTGCLPINILIQDYVLPPLEKRGFYCNCGGYDIYKGDKVINLKNARPRPNQAIVSAPIYNGNMGEVIEVGFDYLKVDFYNIGEVYIYKSHLENIALGYAITVHKSQGSTIPYTISAIDFSHFSMLTRQLVYTTMTRAKKKCVMIFETNALIKAINTNKITQKDTFLYYFLTGELEM